LARRFQVSDKVKFAVHKGRPILTVWWPDRLRSRIRIPSDENGQRKRLMIELSLLDGTWETVRASLIEGEESESACPQAFQAIADEYFEAWVTSHNRSTAAKKSFLKRFKSRFRNVPPKAFRMLHADHYVAWRRASGVANSSINRELSCLRHMFAWATKRGYINRNPLEAMEKLREQEWAGPKPTDEIIQKVFEKLDPRFLPIFIVIRETGARRGEVLGLQHWQVDREERLVTYARRTKNGKCTVAPLTQKAINAIDSIPRLEGCDYVFYNPETGARWCDARKPWEDARKAAGYPWLRVRDLRPAFAIEASERGAPMHFIQSVLGHGSVSVTEKHYARFDPRSAAKQLLRVIEGGRDNQEMQPGGGTKTGTTGS
jgi:integrase